jgi:hypothetical protein
MRITAFIVAMLLLASTQKSKATIYPWTFGQNAEIEGVITDPVSVSVVLVSFTPGTGFPSFGYSLRADYLLSTDANGNVYSSGGYDVTISADPNQPVGDGFSYFTTVSVNSLPVQITDSARLLVSSPLSSRGFGEVGGQYTLGLSLPDGLGVLGETPFGAAAPEPSTWAMMLVGFAVVGFITYRKRKNGLALTA